MKMGNEESNQPTSSLEGAYNHLFAIANTFRDFRNKILKDCGYVDNAVIASLYMSGEKTRRDIELQKMRSRQ